MFNNVWFYILLYAIAGAITIIADAKMHTIMRTKLDTIDEIMACRFDDMVLIVIESPVLRYACIVAGIVMWPVATAIVTAKRIIAYNGIIKGKL